MNGTLLGLLYAFEFPNSNIFRTCSSRSTELVLCNALERVQVMLDAVKQIFSHETILCFACWIWVEAEDSGARLSHGTGSRPKKE
jgi:hypothetical protein